MTTLTVFCLAMIAFGNPYSVAVGAGLMVLGGLYNMVRIGQLARATPKQPAPPEIPGSGFPCPECGNCYLLFTGVIPKKGWYRHACPCGYHRDIHGVVSIPRKQTDEHAA